MQESIKPCSAVLIDTGATSSRVQQSRQADSMQAICGRYVTTQSVLLGKVAALAAAESFLSTVRGAQAMPQRSSCCEIRAGTPEECQVSDAQPKRYECRHKQLCQWGGGDDLSSA